MRRLIFPFVVSICASAGTCPSSFPWAYRPANNFDHCCATSNDCMGNVGINARAPELRSQCCNEDEYVACTSPPCRDYPISYYAMSQGTCCCPARGCIDTKSECERALEILGLTRGSGIRWEGDTSLIPAGCTFKAELAEGHWNDREEGSAREDLAPICKKMPQEDAIWDFIVVGAGTGGSLCAGRLADAGAEVLLLEAGHWDAPELYSPGAYSRDRNGPSNVWSYPTRLPRNLEVHNTPPYRQKINAGKLMGGSSSIHGDVYDRPPFGEFEYRGMTKWSKDRVRTALMRFERDAHLTFRGEDHLDQIPDAQFFVIDKIMQNMSLPFYPRHHPNGGKGGVTAGWWYYRQCSSGHTFGQACSRRTTYTDFVASRNASNESQSSSITVLDDALVSQVLIENGEAVGVELLRHGKAHKVFARRAVVLAAGALGTPRILTLSGIGDPFDLQRLGIPIQVSNREVGQSLSDHLGYFTWFMIKNLNLSIEDDPGCENRERFNIFYNTSAKEEARDGAVEMEVRFFCGCNDTKKSYDFGVESVLLSPRSRGRVIVPSKSPKALPIAEFPPLWESDFDRMEKGLEQLANALGIPPEEFGDKGITLGEKLRQDVYLYQHFCCSARAAPPEEAGVCDEDLRVRGVDRLYVADASALPFLPSAHTSSAVVLVAELAAEHAVEHAHPRASFVETVMPKAGTGASASEGLLESKPSELPKAVPVVRLRTGASAEKTPQRPQVDLPVIGLGTGTIPLSRIAGAIAAFVQAGGRHLDTAVMYDNYAQMKEGIQASGINNVSEIVITFKVMPLGRLRVKRAVSAAIEGIGVPYIDIALLHWPGDIASGKLLHGMPLPECAEPIKSVDGTDVVNVSWRHCRDESYSALLEELEAGRVRAVGVSNFAARHLDEFASQGYPPPAVHQLELHPLWHDEELLERHFHEGVRIQAYGCLGGAHTKAVMIRQDGFKKIAQRKRNGSGVSTAQVLLRWVFQRGATILTGGSTDKHVKENLDIFDFELDADDMDFMDSSAPESMQKMYGPLPEEIL